MRERAILLIHRPRLSLSGSNGNVKLLGVFDEVVAAGETVVELWHSPWRNDVDAWLSNRGLAIERAKCLS